MDPTDGRGRHGVEPKECARRHHNLPAILLRELNKVFARQRQTAQRLT